MERIPAKELVLGFPVNANVSAAQRGTIRIETEGRAFGLNLETGAFIAPEAAVVHAPPLALTSHLALADASSLSPGFERMGRYLLWDGRATTIPPRTDFTRSIRFGTDDVVVVCTRTEIHMLDRRNNERRTIALPPAIDLRDSVTGGLRGNLDRDPIYIEPGFIVFSRSPGLLVVTRDDLERALVFNRTTWAIETILAIREPERSTPATRGKWRTDTVVTDAGVLQIDARAEPVRAYDRMWPPNGWAMIELADHTSIPAFPEPASRLIDAAVIKYPLLHDRPATVTWRAVQLPAPPAPPKFFEELAHAPPRPTLAGAVAYAEAVGLDAKLATNAIESLRALAGSSYPDRYKAKQALLALLATPNGAFAIPSLVALAADPRTPIARASPR